MEPENETQEMQQFFHNLSDSRSIDARYNQIEGGRAVAYLDASRGRDYGPVWSKELAQGDSLHAAVLGMLYDPKEKPKLKNLLTGIGRQNALRSGLEGANLTGTSSLGLQPLWLALQLARQLEKAPVPESYLGYILYDQDSVRYDSGRVEISRNAFTNPEELALDITATQGGFVEVYVYNASSSPVWYDQFSISSSQAVIIQENHYYPFGMQIAGLELDLGSRNRYLYNGKELQDDHNLDWHDYGARMYDAQIGRWHVVDPMADSYLSFSPYNYTLNNPISLVDPNGMWVEKSNLYFTEDQKPDFGDIDPATLESPIPWFFGKLILKMFSKTNGKEKGQVDEFDGRALDEVVTISKLEGGQNREDNAESDTWDTVSNLNNGLGFVAGGASESLGRTIHARAEVRNLAGWNKTTGGSLNKVLIKGFPVSRSILNGTAQTLKVGGATFGFVGLGMTGYEIYSGQKGLVGEGGLDLIMGGVAFIPGGGWVVSGAYFGGKALLEYTGNDFWKEPKK